MALKDILVHLDPSARSAVRLGIAAELASRFDAHLTGLLVIEIPRPDYLYGAGLPLAGLDPDQMIGGNMAEARKAATSVEAGFTECLRSRGLQGTWRIADGHAASVISEDARCADLVVVGQPNDPRRQDNRDRDVVETVLMTSGRPVLTVPFVGDFPQPTDHILVAWNASREATRAVHDAMPLLTKARQVTVLAVNPAAWSADSQAEPRKVAIATHLARHGVKADVHRTVATDISEGDALLSYAADISASMIVAGGYGHSRARELIFGGVTRTLLTAMTIPVLFSH